MDVFYSIDLTIFYFFNHTISTGFLDRFFSTITNVHNWYIAYVILIGILLFKGGRMGRLAVVGIIVLIIVTDLTGYRVLKELFQRARPCIVLPDVLLPIGCTGTYSFPSNHALNNFAAAAFFTKLFPGYKTVLFVTASLLAISRVYLGLHYPSDIIAGAAIGVVFGYIFGFAILKVNDFIERKYKNEDPTVAQDS
ncbi:MAG: phosphatase PAP2 family protein [Bacteroidetes bacterium]|nr:phosphatase PAP2 family protein [Bacteroidota bacterium]MCH7770196.1 phosphatase PAP2 family protein [Bacteroidota bacterium]